MQPLKFSLNMSRLDERFLDNLWPLLVCLVCRFDALLALGTKVLIYARTEYVTLVCGQLCEKVSLAKLSLQLHHTFSVMNKDTHYVRTEYVTLVLVRGQLSEKDFVRCIETFLNTLARNVLEHILECFRKCLQKFTGKEIAWFPKRWQGPLCSPEKHFYSRTVHRNRKAY